MVVPAEAGWQVVLPFQRQLFFEPTAKNAVSVCSTSLLPQSGQVTSSSSYSSRVRIFENAFWQEWQKYSYCGMVFLLLGVLTNFSAWPLLGSTVFVLRASSGQVADKPAAE